MVTADHSRSANEGLRSVLKFRLDLNYGSPVENQPKISGFLKKKWSNVKFSFRDPKSHIFPRNDVFRRIERQNRHSGLG